MCQMQMDIRIWHMSGVSGTCVGYLPHESPLMCQMRISITYDICYIYHMRYMHHTIYVSTSTYTYDICIYNLHLHTHTMYVSTSTYTYDICIYIYIHTIYVSTSHTIYASTSTYTYDICIYISHTISHTIYASYDICIYIRVGCLAHAWDTT